MEIIVVYTAETEFSRLEKYLDCVSAARRNAVLKKSTDEGRVQSLAAALLVRSELSRRLGIPQKSVSFKLGAHGKPYISGGGAQFSVSHTTGAVCAAFSDGDNEIGVDIERCDRRVSGRLKQRALSKNEFERCVADEDFLRMWVQKEAFLKRTGIGLATVICGVDTTQLKDIAAYSCGEYFIGCAGRAAESAEITVLPLDKLLRRFD